MKYATMLALPVLAALAACASEKPSQINYQCDNGQPLMTQIMNDNKIAVQLNNGKIETLHQVVAASGTRYMGENWQWWSKGMTQGTLTPVRNGEIIKDAKAIRCDASAPEAL